MTLQQGVVFAGLAVLIVELVRGKRSPAAIFAAVAFAFILLDYIPLNKGLQQFTNSGLITVVVLLLLSVVLDKSRLLEEAAEQLIRGPYRWALAKLLGLTSKPALNLVFRYLEAGFGLLAPNNQRPKLPPGCSPPVRWVV